MVVKLSATDLETGRRLAARKRGRSVVRILPEADDLVAINRITKQIRELLWRRDDPDNMRACRALVREQARLSLAYERRHGKAPNIKHV
ncbi:hypothetical protein [Bradyrhizobium sp. 145]|uniref:hypothetical protein n=1 Tax=Bradyrhizobium sp. 145 TaxID=2782621 RepID=UPI001FF7EE83|nr:hypothetical protein [Bradyrhizobium sp. 145]MCK1691459.1 hypothetical protein [Bradyrhizobium sp. 145]